MPAVRVQSSESELIQDVSMSTDEGHQGVVRMDEDPEEAAGAGGASLPSGERYKLRTQVFERLLLFVNESAKQPQRDLIDLADLNDYV